MKDTPQAPTPPDPAATAAAQATANKETAVAQANLNRINQYTPQGSLTYRQIGTNADGTPQYEQTQAYSPAEQQKYDQNNQIAIALNGLAGKNIDRVNVAQSQPFSYDGMQAMRTSVGGGQPGLQTGPSGSGPITTSVNGQPVQTSLDYSGAQKIPGLGDFAGEAKRTQDAVYQQAASRLDPQFKNNQDAMDARLAAQGIARGSEAANREIDTFTRGKNDAYNQANFDSIQAGSAEQSRLFNLAMGARQQSVNEANAQGQFANQAQDQRYTQDLGNATLNNSAQGQIFGQGQSAAAFNNQARSQGFNEDVTNANFQNNARQQQIQEATYLRNLPLNEIAALLGTGGGVQNPTFQNVAQVGVAAPDYQGAVYANYNAANQQYQSAMAARSQGLGSIFGTVGSLGAAAISDARVKHNITRIGELANGLATYVFSYIGSPLRVFGVLAQETLGVVPDAVIFRPDGLMAVDYGKVW